MTAPLRIVVVGGVAGGMSAATRLRRLDESAEITVVERSGHVSYANCGLPYFVGGVIEDEDDLLLQTPERLHERFRLDVRVDTEVVGIDTDAHTATVRSTVDGSEYVLRFDKLVLSPGAVPGPTADPRLRPGARRSARSRTPPGWPPTWRPPRSGRGHRCRIHRPGDGREPHPRRHRRDGGGSGGPGPHPARSRARHPGARPSWWPTGSPWRPARRSPRSPTTRVVLADGRLVPAELVVGSIGVRPDTRLAVLAGSALGPSGGIAVDRGRAAPAIRTSTPSATPSRRTTRSAAVRRWSPWPTWPTARAAVPPTTSPAWSARRRPPSARRSSRSSRVTAAMTGWNETRLRAAGRPYRAIHSHPMSHATYYPGAEQMSLKLLFDPVDGTILGAQAVGGDGVDKRIDVLATATDGRHAGPRTGRPRARLRPALLLGQGPGQHARLHGREHPLGRVRRDRAGRTRSAGGLRMDTPRRPHRRPSTVPGPSPGASVRPSTRSRALLTSLGAGPFAVYCQVGQRGHTATEFLHDEGFEGAQPRRWLPHLAGRAGRPAGRRRYPRQVSFVNIRWTSSSGYPEAADSSGCSRQ